MPKVGRRLLMNGSKKTAGFPQLKRKYGHFEKYAENNEVSIKNQLNERKLNCVI